MTVEQDGGWRTPIIQYLRDGEEPTFKAETQKLRYKTSHYMLIDNVLYKCGHSFPLPCYLDGEEVEYVLREIHKGVYGNHSVGRSLNYKVLR